MTSRVVLLLAVTAALTACGTTAKPKPQRAPVPDVRGMNVNDAAVRLIKARYCVRLEPGKTTDTRPEPGHAPTQMLTTVRRESPAAGSTRRTWATVTLTVDGIPAHAAVSIDIWDGGTHVPCPPIRTTG